MTNPNPKTEVAKHPPLFAAPSVAKRLKNAQDTLAALESQYRNAALEDAIHGTETLAQIRSTLLKARDNVADLTAAHGVALERDTLEAARQCAAQRKSQINVARSHLNIRDKAARAYSVALAEAIKQFRLMIEHSAKAKNAVPEWGIKPGAMLEFGEIEGLAEQEIFRLGADPGLGNRFSHPGGHAPMSMLQQPEKIKPLPVSIHEASEYFLAVLTGKEM